MKAIWRTGWTRRAGARWMVPALLLGAASDLRAASASCDAFERTVREALQGRTMIAVAPVFTYVRTYGHGRSWIRPDTFFVTQVARDGNVKYFEDPIIQKDVVWTPGQQRTVFTDENNYNYDKPGLWLKFTNLGESGTEWTAEPVFASVGERVAIEEGDNLFGVEKKRVRFALKRPARSPDWGRTGNARPVVELALDGRCRAESFFESLLKVLSTEEVEGSRRALARIDAAISQYRSEASAVAKLEKGREIERLIAADLPGIRNDPAARRFALDLQSYTNVGGEIAAERAALEVAAREEQARAAAAALRGTMASLRAGARRARDAGQALRSGEPTRALLGEARSALAGMTAEAATVEGLLRTAGLGDLGEPSLLSEAEALLTEARTLQPDLESEAVRYERALEGRERDAEIGRLDRAFSEMRAESAQSLEAFTRAFGTSREADARRGLLAHLRRMRDNRLKAKALGSATAGTDAAKLEEQIRGISARAE